MNEKAKLIILRDGVEITYEGEVLIKTITFPSPIKMFCAGKIPFENRTFLELEFNIDRVLVNSKKNKKKKARM